MNSNEYITQTLLNNLVGMKYRGSEIIETKQLGETIVASYKKRGFRENLIFSPNSIIYAFLGCEKIKLVVSPGFGLHAEYVFEK